MATCCYTSYKHLLKAEAAKRGLDLVYSPPTLVPGSITPPSSLYPGTICYYVYLDIGEKRFSGFGQTAFIARTAAEFEAYKELSMTNSLRPGGPREPFSNPLCSATVPKLQRQFTVTAGGSFKREECNLPVVSNCNKNNNCTGFKESPYDITQDDIVWPHLSPSPVKLSPSPSPSPQSPVPSPSHARVDCSYHVPKTSEEAMNNLICSAINPLPEKDSSDSDKEEDGHSFSFKSRSRRTLNDVLLQTAFAKGFLVSFELFFLKSGARVKGKAGPFFCTATHQSKKAAKRLTTIKLLALLRKQPDRHPTPLLSPPLSSNTSPMQQPPLVAPEEDPVMQLDNLTRELEWPFPEYVIHSNNAGYFLCTVKTAQCTGIGMGTSKELAEVTAAANVLPSLIDYSQYITSSELSAGATEALHDAPPTSNYAPLTYDQLPEYDLSLQPPDTILECESDSKSSSDDVIFNNEPVSHQLSYSISPPQPHDSNLHVPSEGIQTLSTSALPEPSFDAGSFQDSISLTSSPIPEGQCTVPHRFNMSGVSSLDLHPLNQKRGRGREKRRGRGRGITKSYVAAVPGGSIKY